jgi:hypothetical protein
MIRRRGPAAMPSNPALNARISRIPMPSRIAKLPISDQGYPVPYFVRWIDGKPDFRIMDSKKLVDCVSHKKCWVCGEQLGQFLCFAIGPMCMCNHVSSEPPSHHDCAAYSTQACPFLTMPNMRRNEKDLPEEHGAAGIMLRRNPGVVLIWTCTEYKPFRVDNGVLFQLGDPVRLEFFREGRTATREEILESIESGKPELIKAAERDGPDGLREMEKAYQAALRMVPA